MSLIPLGVEVCPDCGNLTNIITWSQSTLFISNGYGESSVFVVRRCICGWSLETERLSISPNKVDKT